MKKLLAILAIFGMLGLSACTTQTRVVDVENDETDHVAGLEYRDFENTADKMVKDILSSGVLNKPEGGRYVLIVGRIVNDTMQKIDTAQISKKIRIQLMKSGKVAVTTMQEDSNIMATRKLRNEDEVNQATVAGKGKIIAPDLSLSGSINQRNFIENGEQWIEYIFSLSITNIETGLTFWEGEIPVIKITDKDTKTW